MNFQTVRKTFLDFFQSKEHQIVPSAPMVIKNDPTLMFTNAGMNQFKDIFLGNMESKYPRVADTQKCLRVSGKHNDLEEVGHDTYHHTMFEMLGNWSFGDYFKKEAIEWGWELLAGVFKIDPGRMYVTVFGGDPSEGLEKDHEAFEFWKKIIPEDRILFGSKKDNFWEMGDTGPCGPCSEIHVDLRDEEVRKKVPGKDLVNTGNPLVIEIWNLVFIEFNRQANGQLVQLPAKHVDTGMGFERLCMVLQGKKSNYDTDIFQPIIRAIAQKAGIAYGKDAKSDIAMRVIADHLRAISFAIADGQVPSNNKAGYVIRRILRRAVRYGYVFLDLKDPFIFEFVPLLVQLMGDAFPELEKQKSLVMNVIREEEAAFLRTLSTGIQKFNSYINQKSEVRGQRSENSRQSAVGSQQSISSDVIARSEATKQTASTQGIISGSFAFELFDTYGFPVDLTELMAKENGWSVDMEGFTKGLEQQKARSRNAAIVETADWTILIDNAEMTEFVGYDKTEAETKIIKFRKVISKDQVLYHVVLQKTPFYAESGGQVGDTGILTGKDDAFMEVFNTIKENDQIIHITGTILEDPTVAVKAKINIGRRRLIQNNHSATHLLHAALRKILGTHVEQKGSVVDENRLRFDFTHFTKLTKEEISQVEHLVNLKIRENIPIREERSVPVEKAKEMGAMALFGEKYGDTVRVISFDPAYSVELCGGTHVPATGQIGMLKIVSEGAIAAGIRRIEAITADKAEEFLTSRLDLLEEIRELLKNPKDMLKGLSALLEENQSLKKSASEYEKLKILARKDEFLARIKPMNGINFIAEKVEMDAESAKTLAFELCKATENLFLVFAGEIDGKAHLTVMVTENLVKEKGLHAGNIIRELAKEIQGGGGGQPHIATAGGKNPAGIPAVIEKARSFIS